MEDILIYLVPGDTTTTTVTWLVSLAERCLPVQTSIVVNSFCGYFKVDIQQAPAPSVENLKNKKLENIQNAEISYIICRCVEPKMIRDC